MLHIIAPVTIDGDDYCVTVDGKASHTVNYPWRTESVLSDLASLAPGTTEDDDSWTIYDYPINYSGKVQFGTCCISTVYFRFAFDVDNLAGGVTNYPTVYLKLNGDTVWEYTKAFLAAPTDTQANAIYEDVVVDLVTGVTTVTLIRGPNNPGGAYTEHPGSNKGTTTAFDPARDNPCGNVWEITASTPAPPYDPVYCRVEVMDVT